MNQTMPVIFTMLIFKLLYTWYTHATSSKLEYEAYNFDISKDQSVVEYEQSYVLQKFQPPFQIAKDRKCPEKLFNRLQDLRQNYKASLTKFNLSSVKTGPVLNRLKYDNNQFKQIQWEIFDLMRTNINSYEIVDYRFVSKDFVQRYHERLMQSISGQKLILCGERHYQFLQTKGDFIIQ